MELERVIDHLIVSHGSGIRIETQRIKRSWFLKQGLVQLYDEHAVILENRPALSKFINSMGILPSNGRAGNFTGICRVCTNETDFLTISSGFKQCCSKECTAVKSSATRSLNPASIARESQRISQNSISCTLRELVLRFLLSGTGTSVKLEGQRISRRWFELFFNLKGHPQAPF